MILRQNTSSRPNGTPPVAAASAVPAWLRRAVSGIQAPAGQGLEEVALVAGAALAALDAVVRGDERWSGVWRHRLALAAAAVAAKQAGRIEDEAALRDAVLLARPGDDVGPAGRLLLGWHHFATRPVADLLTEKNLAAVLEAFGYAADEAVGDLADALRQLSGGGMVGNLTGAFTAAERHGFGRSLGAFIADALLAQFLGWRHAVPLMGAEATVGTGRPRRAEALGPATGHDVGVERTKTLLAAQARAALRAIDLFGDLGRRADKLLAVAPKLRAKGAGAIVDRLLNEDALVASRGTQKGGMSDRGLRRLFDRLVELGAVRELSGRPTFRIYGL
jgi:hypothetical protein